MHPEINSLRIYPDVSRELAAPDFFATISYSQTSTLINKLFASCAPSTILWTVIGIVIRTNKRMKCSGSSAHINEKGLIAFSPLIANLYASSAPQMKLRAALVVAPGFHGDPSQVLGRSFVAMAKVCLRRAFFLHASATLRMAATKVRGVRNSSAAAIASTTPSCPPTLGRRLVDHDQTTKSRSGKIQFATHRAPYHEGYLM